MRNTLWRRAKKLRLLTQKRKGEAAQTHEKDFNDILAQRFGQKPHDGQTLKL